MRSEAKTVKEYLSELPEDRGGDGQLQEYERHTLRADRRAGLQNDPQQWIAIYEKALKR